jgi:hypothetical protein
MRYKHPGMGSPDARFVRADGRGPRPPVTPRPRGRLRRGAAIVALVALAVAAGGAIGLVVMRRLRTGAWEMPDKQDLVLVQRTLTGAEPPVSRVIYLDRAPRTLAPGTDDARRRVSSVIAHAGTVARNLPGWKGSAKAWNDTVACVRRVFAPYAVEVTDQPPSTDDHILVVVGGKPADIGAKNKRISGLAPFSGGLIPRAVVFAFAATQGHKPQPVCETIAMEVAHAYGLDHQYLCSDVMSYLRPCGKRSFVDKDARCGEEKARPCAGGAAIQNSHRRLLAVLGPRPR